MLRGRFVAADPDLARFRAASRATVSLVLGLAVAALLVRLTGGPGVVAVFAGVLAMVSAAAVQDATAGARAITVVCLPLVAGLALVLAALSDPYPLLADAAFVVVMGGAAYARRYGPRGAALGTVAFMSFFFALFLAVKPAQLPLLLAGAVLSAGAMSVVRFLVLPDRPASDLRRMLRAFIGRVGAVCEDAARTLRAPDDDKVARRMRVEVAQLDQVALRIEQQLEHPRLAALVVDAEGLRGRLFAAEQAAEHVSAAVQADLGRLDPDARERLAGTAVRTARHLRAAVSRPGPFDPAPVAAGVGAQVLSPRGPGAETHVDGALRHLAQQLDAVGRYRVDGSRGRAPDRRTQPVLTGVGLLPEDLVAGDEHPSRSAPTTPEAAEPADAPDERPGPDEAALARRAALQVSLAGALAIVGGQALSTQRWYWAVITAFVVFTNAPTRVVTTRRALLRVLGTVLGVVAGLLVGAVLAGQPVVELAAVVVLVFVAFYCFQLSYAVTIFCFTVMLALLYSLLGVLTTALLVLRLEETLLGAAVAVGVSLLVVPQRASTAIVDTVDDLLGRVDDVLVAVTQEQSPARLRETARSVDEAFQSVRAVIRPAVIGVPGRLPRRRRRQLLAVAGTRYWARVLASAVAVHADSPLDHERVAQVRHRVAAVRANADVPASLRDHAADHAHGSSAEALDRLDRSLDALVEQLDGPQAAAAAPHQGQHR